MNDTAKQRRAQGKQLGRSIARLLQALNDEHWAHMVGPVLAWDLQELPAVPERIFRKLLGHLRYDDRTAAAVRRVFVSLGLPALRRLMDFLAAGDGAAPADIARAIGAFGPAAAEAVPFLRPLLAGPPRVRVEAAMALWEITGRTEELAPIVAEGLERCPERAAAYLHDMGPEAAATVPKLLTLLQSSDTWHRPEAAYALGGIGIGAVEAIPALSEAARDRNEIVRSWATAALAKFHTLANVADLLLAEFSQQSMRTTEGGEYRHSSAPRQERPGYRDDLRFPVE
jgi:hypothetical protein